VAEFIRIYVTRHKRWSSPKFVIGESYGTTRAAALSGELSQHLKMNVNGIMLVSTVLNFQTLDFNAGNDLPYVLYLPSYTAAAWFHKKTAGGTCSNGRSPKYLPWPRPLRRGTTRQPCSKAARSRRPSGATSSSNTRA